jgi:EpsI family protein
MIRSRQAVILSLALIAQAVLFYGFSPADSVPASRPLKEFSKQLGDWTMSVEGVIDKETLDVLRADDTVTRVYRQNGTGRPAGLFVAYFQSQRTGQAPHSPKNCLPGAGWTPSASGVMTIAIQGRAEPIQVNRYIVTNGDSQSVVLYWYQSRDRVIASEYSAKFYVVADSIRYHRSDTALVRVVTPVIDGDQDAATQASAQFVQAFFQPLRQLLPN